MSSQSTSPQAFGQSGDQSGDISTDALNVDPLNYFFDCCVGHWDIERTYHYLSHQQVERSHTEFEVVPIPLDLKAKVLIDNGYAEPPDLEPLPGFRMKFHTVSETGEEVSQELRTVFVPHRQHGQILEGAYLRDRAYEEARPIVSDFSYNAQTHELLMTTRYTQVVSVDSITLINPNLRIRRIYNYRRPTEGEPLETMLLVGFGVEQKK